jgi:hypothetical protein
MDGKESVGAERYGTLFKWLYVDIGSRRLNIHVDVREIGNAVGAMCVSHNRK